MSEFKEYEDQLKDCPICGSRPIIYSGAASEPHGRSIQTMSIDCSDTKGQHCIHGVAVETDTDYVTGHLPLLMTMWNNLSAR